MNTVLDISFSLSTGLKAVTFALSCIILVHILPFLLDPHKLRSYPGPLFARLSDLWLGSAAARGRVIRAVMDAHRTYGPIVRIAPNHISIADASALQSIYSHGSGALKSDMYDTFGSLGRRSMFSTRSREEHTRKRKNLSHTFSQKTTSEFEPVVRQYLASVVKQWDLMCSAAASGKAGVIGEMAWRSQGGRAVFDTLKWYDFMVFDIVGDLVFRAPFGMTERGSDMARIAKRPDQALASFESSDTKLEYDTVNAVEAVNQRGAFVFTLGMLPAWWRPLLKSLPLRWSRAGVSALDKMAAMAITAVANRSQYTETRNDILAKYFEATDEHGQPLDNVEISTEAVSLIIAGTDTTSNSLAAITFYLAQNPDAQTKLQAELDEALGAPTGSDTEINQPILSSYDDVKNLPYLQDVVNEGLRLFSTVGVGLPRVVPEDGLTVLGHIFAPGTVVSVPLYVVHRDKVVWGEDADVFNPDRWARGDRATMAKAFAPFSVGPRACIGRNLALMELLIVIANVFHRYDAVLAHPGQIMDIHDGLLRKPHESTVSLKRRSTA